MYKCNKCEKVFKYPQTEVEIHNEFLTNNKEYFYICPWCGSGRIERMEKND